jgi:hypothetical protein
MKRVYSSHDGLFVEYLQRLLEEEGITTMQRNQYLSGGAGELPPNECWLELWVMSDADLDRAQALVDTAANDLEGPHKDWVCPACGEQIEGQFGTCWNCGCNNAQGDTES